MKRKDGVDFEAGLKHLRLRYEAVTTLIVTMERYERLIDGAEAAGVKISRRGRSPGTMPDRERKAVSARMKRYWAQQRAVKDDYPDRGV